MPDTTAATPVEHFVVSPEGRIVTVPAEQVDRALKEGYRPATVDEQIKGASAREAGEHPVSAAALGALSMVPGLQSAVTGIAGGRKDAQLAAQGVEQIQAQNPNATLAGQVAGAVGVGAMGGPTSLAGAAALGGALSGASSAEHSAIGQLADTGNVDAGEVAKQAGIGGALGAATGGLVGAAASRILPRALANSGPIAGAAKVLGLQAAGGAVASTVSQAAEDLIADKDLAAEQLLAAAGRGALFGVASGITPTLAIGRALRGRPAPMLPETTEAPTPTESGVRLSGTDAGALDHLTPGLGQAARDATSPAFDAAVSALGSKDAVNGVMADARAAGDSAVAAAGPVSLAKQRSLYDRAAEMVFKRHPEDVATLRRYFDEQQVEGINHDEQLNDATRALGGTVNDVLSAGAELNAAERHAQVEDAMRDLTGGDPEKMKVAMRAADEVRRAKEKGVLVSDADQEARSAADAVRDAMTGEHTVRKLANGLGKAEQMAELVPEQGQDGAAGPMIRDAVTEALKQAREFADKYKNTAGVKTSVRELANRIDRFDVLMQKSKLSNRDMFMLLDDLKQGTGKVADFGREGPTSSLDQNAAVGQARELYNALRDHLQREDLYGRGAVAQEAINRPLSDKIGLGKQFKQDFVARYGDQHGEPVFEGKASAFKSFLENPFGAESRLTERGIGDYVKTTRDYYDAVEEHYKLTPSEKRDVANARRAIDHFEQLVTDAKVRAQAKAIVERVNATPTGGEQQRDFLVRQLGMQGAREAEANHGAIRGLLSNILEPSADAKQRALTEYAPALTDQILRLENRGGLSPEQKTAITRARKAVGTIEPSLTKARDEASYIARIKALKSEEQGHGGAVAGLIAGGVGHAVAGPFGVGAGLVTLLAHGTTKPLAALAKIAEVQRTISNVKATLRISGAKAVGVDPAKVAAAEGETLGHGEPIKPPPRMTDDEVVKRINDLRAESPEQRQARAAKLAQDLRAHVPKLAVTLSVTASNALNYIAANMPQPSSSGLALQPLLDKPRYSQAQIQTARDVIETGEHPMVALARVGEGRLSQASADCLKAVYPLLYKELQRSISVALTLRDSPLAWEQAKAISRLFDVPASAALQPEFMTAMQATKQPTQQDAAGGASAPRRPRALSKIDADQPEMRTASEQVALAR